MAIRRLDGWGGYAIAYLTTETAAGETFLHLFISVVAVPMMPQMGSRLHDPYIVFVQPLVALIAVFLILLVPRLLN